MEKTITKNMVDMTKGPLLSKIILFVLPLMATNVLQVFYNMADMIVVGLSEEANAVGAVGTCGAYVNLFLNTIIGVSVGVNVIVAHDLGAKDSVGVKNAIHTGTIVGFLFGVLFGAIGAVIANPVLEFLGNEGNLLYLSTEYSIIYLCGMPFMGLTNCAVSIFRAKGDTKTPLIILTLSGIFNVVMNLFFVLVCKMSVDGVALATLLSNALSAVILYMVLAKDKDICNFSLKNLKVNLRATKKILIVGIPSAIQGALFSISNMIIQSSILQVDNMLSPANAKYQPVVKGNSAASNMEGIIYNATNSVYQAATSFVGQNYGVKDFKRIKKVRWCCYGVTFVISVVVGAIMILLRDPLLAFYGIVNGNEGSLENIAYNTAITRIMYMFIPYFTLAFMEVGSGILRGQRYSVLSTVISLIGACVLRIIWIYTVFRINPTLEIIYLSYPISWTATALAHFIFGAVLINKAEKKYNMKKSEVV